jgi:adenylate cyclase
MFIKLYKQQLKWRIAILFSTLILMLSGTTLLISNRANISNAETNITANLAITAEVFQQIIESRIQSLKDIARPATSDHAFRQVYSEGDIPTLISAMKNLTARIKNIDNTIMMLVDFDNNMIASTTELNTQDQQSWQHLLENAEQNSQLEADGVVIIDKQPYELVVTPLLIPDPEAWVLMGFALDQDFASTASGITQSSITIFSQPQRQASIKIHASTFDKTQSDRLASSLKGHQKHRDHIWQVSLDQDQYLTSILSLDAPNSNQLGAKQATLFAAIQGSLTQELAPYKRLNLMLAGIFLLGGIITLLATGFLSGSITKPVVGLSQGVAEIGAGNYKVRVAQDRQDEIGDLSKSINEMAGNLEEKEKIRQLLGRSVSTEVAEELLNNDIQVAGEEREVTVLFADLRGFTGLSENLQPTELLAFLNDYFDCISNVINEFNGVVDKYIGDEVMAIFGAPVQRDNHAELAVKAAIGMQQALMEFKVNNKDTWNFDFETGIGINTDQVVVGNMGSKLRNNYTVIGDGVNVASRLQSESKNHPYSIIVSHNTVAAAPEFNWRALGHSKIRGKNELVEIYGLDFV